MPFFMRQKYIHIYSENLGFRKTLMVTSYSNALTVEY